MKELKTTACSGQTGAAYMNDKIDCFLLYFSYFIWFLKLYTCIIMIKIKIKNEYNENVSILLHIP